jgi:cell division transport system ATP-binding protein
MNCKRPAFWADLKIRAIKKMIGNSIIKLNNVDIFQQSHLVLSNVNLHIDKGDFVWLIGQTGSGKSSLLKVIYGDLSIASGTGHACGYELSKLATKDVPYLRRKLGIVFQDFQLLTDRSVEQNLQFVMRATGWTIKNKLPTVYLMCWKKLACALN